MNGRDTIEAGEELDDELETWGSVPHAPAAHDPAARVSQGDALEDEEPSLFRLDRVDSMTTVVRNTYEIISR